MNDNTRSEGNGNFDTYNIMSRHSTFIHSLSCREMCRSLLFSWTFATILFLCHSYEPHLRAKIASSVAKGERRAQERRAVGRVLCPRCRRPTPIQCVCNSLPPSLIATATDVVILQHPNEFRKKSVSTVPLLSLVLQNVRVLVGESFDTTSDRPIRDAISEGNTLLLVFPGVEAISLDSLGLNGLSKCSGRTDTVPTFTSNDARHRPKHTLVLVDGTWTQAARIIRNSPTLLEACQRVQFTASDSTSIYHAIRREPQRHYRSTLEASVQALSLLEPDSDSVALASKHLYAALETLVNAQLQYKSNDSSEANPRFVSRPLKSAMKKRRQLELERELFDGGAMHVTPWSEPHVHDVNHVERAALVQTSLSDGAILRSLVHYDVPLIDSRWPYRSAKSITMIYRLIESQGASSLGIERDGSLCAFIMRYQNGAIGMLPVEEPYRRRGYAAALLTEATRVLQERGEPCFAYILEGNVASEALFAKQGWVREDPNKKRKTGRRRAKRKWIKPFV